MRKAIFESLKRQFRGIRELLIKNWWIATVSFVLAIPLLIISIYALREIVSWITDIQELKSIMVLCGTMLTLPFLSIYLYVVLGFSSKGRAPARILLFIILFGLVFFTIVASIKILNSIGESGHSQDNFILSVFVIDVYVVSFILTKLMHYMYTYLLSKIRKIASWLVDGENENNDILKAKLSFINKILQ